MCFCIYTAYINKWINIYIYYMYTVYRFIMYIYIYTKIKGVPNKNHQPPPKNGGPPPRVSLSVFCTSERAAPRETRRSEASDHHRNTKSTEALVKNYDSLDIPVSRKLLGYNLLMYGVYWGYNPFANHLLTSWDIQVGMVVWFNMRTPEWMNLNIPPNLWFVWAIVDMKISNTSVSKCEKGKIYVCVTVYAYKFSIYRPSMPSIKSCIMSTFSSDQGFFAEICHLSIRGSLVAGCSAMYVTTQTIGDTVDGKKSCTPYDARKVVLNTSFKTVSGITSGARFFPSTPLLPLTCVRCFFLKWIRSIPWDASPLIKHHHLGESF